MTSFLRHQLLLSGLLSTALSAAACKDLEGANSAERSTAFSSSPAPTAYETQPLPKPKAVGPVPKTVIMRKQSEAAVPPQSQLPGDIHVGVPTEVLVPGERPLRVTHAPAEVDHAIVYLHGMCGNPKGADPWADLAAERGTLIVLRATVPCPDRPGYKWPTEVTLIQQRVDAALDFVAEERGGLLDKKVLTIVGYSQGANRAEKLAALAPERYPLVILGGAPTAPSPELLHPSQRVAILGGELEDTRHMEAGYLDLAQAGIATRFFLLPGAHHGNYGPQGRRVMQEVFTFLDARP